MLIAAVSLAVTTAGYYLSRSHLNEIYQLHYSCKTVYHVSLLALIFVTKMESVYCCKYHRADEIGRVRIKSSKRNYGCGAGRFPRHDHRLSLPVLFIYLFIKAVSIKVLKITVEPFEAKVAPRLEDGMFSKSSRWG